MVCSVCSFTTYNTLLYIDQPCLSAAYNDIFFYFLQMFYVQIYVQTIDVNFLKSPLFFPFEALHVSLIAKLLGLHIDGMDVIGVRLVSLETLLQTKNSTGSRWDSNPGPRELYGCCSKSTKPLRHLEILDAAKLIIMKCFEIVPFISMLVMTKIFREFFIPTLNRIPVIDQYVTLTPVVQKNFLLQIYVQKFA